MIRMNQRPDNRSYRTRGSLVPDVFLTDSKKALVVALSAPRAPVVLSKTLMRLLTPTRNWVGPTAPIVSGGKAPDSPNVDPVKLRPVVWGDARTGGGGSPIFFGGH